MNQQLNAGVAELADAPDLSSGAIWCEGSNPVTRTKTENPATATVAGFSLCLQWFHRLRKLKLMSIA